MSKISLRSISSKSSKVVGAITVAVVGLAASGVALASPTNTPSRPSAITGPRVFIASHDAALFVPFAAVTTLGQLAVPGGKYTVTAKAWMQSQAGSGNSAVNCTLTLGSRSDQSQADAQDGNASTGTEPVRNEVMSLTLAASVSHASVIKLSCRNLGGGNTFLRSIKITAIKVGQITRSTF